MSVRINFDDVIYFSGCTLTGDIVFEQPYQNVVNAVRLTFFLEEALMEGSDDLSKGAPTYSNSQRIFSHTIHFIGNESVGPNIHRPQLLGTEPIRFAFSVPIPTNGTFVHFCSMHVSNNLLDYRMEAFFQAEVECDGTGQTLSCFAPVKIAPIYSHVFKTLSAPLPCIFEKTISGCCRRRKVIPIEVRGLTHGMRFGTPLQLEIAVQSPDTKILSEISFHFVDVVVSPTTKRNITRQATEPVSFKWDPVVVDKKLQSMNVTLPVPEYPSSDPKYYINATCEGVRLKRFFYFMVEAKFPDKSVANWFTHVRIMALPDSTLHPSETGPYLPFLSNEKPS